MISYKQAEKSLGSVSITLTDDAVPMMYNTDFVATEDTPTRNAWYDFLKELRMFALKKDYLHLIHVTLINPILTKEIINS